MSVYLATRGKQDYFLTEKPEFTFFQKTYERDVQHENTIANVPFDSGGGTIATIPANGDYVAEITLKVTLPAIKQPSSYWTFLGTPPSGYVTFYQNSTDTPILSINSTTYLSYISSAGNFLFNFTKTVTTQTISRTAFSIVVYGINYYLLDIDGTISKNNTTFVSLGTTVSTSAYMTISKDGSYIYVTNYYGGNVIKVTTSSMSINPVYVFSLLGPTSISIDNNGIMYILCSYNGAYSVVKIDTSNPVFGNVTKKINLSFTYRILVVNFTGTYVYVLAQDNSITRIDTTTYAVTYNFIPAVTSVYISDMQIDSTDTLYFSDYYGGTIIAVSSQTGTVTPNYIISLSYPVSFSINSGGSFYVLGQNQLYFQIISTGSTSIDYIIFDNVDIANYYCFTNLTQLLGGYYKYSLPVSSSSFNSTSYLDQCGWARLVTNELMKNPEGMATSPDGTLLYFLDSGNSTVRVMNTASPNAVTTIAGSAGITGSANGTGSNARFYIPQGLAINYGGAFLYVADTFNFTIRRVLTGFPYYVETIAGIAGSRGSNDGTLGTSRFFYPQSLAMSPDGSRVYVTDTFNHTIRQVITSGSYPVTTIAGIAGTQGHADGSLGTSTFLYPQALVVSPDGSNIYVADTKNYLIRIVSTSSPYTVTTIAGTVGVIGTADGNGTNASFNLVQSLEISKDGSILYIGDSNALRTMTTAYPYTVTTIAGTQYTPGAVDGNGTNAIFNKIQGLSMSKNGKLVYVSDTGSNLIRQVNTSSPYNVQTLAGSPNISGSSDTGIDTYPDDTMYYYINSISLSVGKQVIQQLPGGYLKMKRDISNNYKNRPILKLLEGDTNTSSSDRVYYLKTGLINNIPMHLLDNQNVQVIVDTKIQQKSLIIDYVSFGSTNLPSEYTLIVPQVQLFHGTGLIDVKSPITKLMSDSPYEFSINGEKLFDSDTSNISQIDNLLNVSTGYINVFRGPMNMSRIRNKAITIKNIPIFDSTSNTWSLPGSNIWSETFNVLRIENGLAGLLFESSFYSFGAPSSYLIS
jgi:sugar lactone lactonase YvrE